MADAVIEGRNNAVNDVVKAVSTEASDEFVEVESSAA
jgi:small subunit ribosomal protein S2